MEVKGDSDTSYPFAVIVTNSDVISLGETFELDGSPSYYRDGNGDDDRFSNIVSYQWTASSSNTIAVNAKALGLIDDFGGASYVAREVIKAEKLVVFSQKKSVLDRFADRIGTKISNMMMQSDGWRLRY